MLREVERFSLSLARHRPGGSVDTASTAIEAPTLQEAIAAATRAMDAFLVGVPGVGILTDTAMKRPVWSRRLGMPRGHGVTLPEA